MPSVKRVSEVLGLSLKIMAAVAILAVIAIVYQTCSGTPIIQRIDRTTPTIEKAPYQVYTATRAYYAKNATQNGSRVIMTGYYTDITGKWVYHKETISLTDKLNPRIVKR
jgi:hypothetical protein